MEPSSDFLVLFLVAAPSGSSGIMGAFLLDFEALLLVSIASDLASNAAASLSFYLFSFSITSRLILASLSSSSFLALISSSFNLYSSLLFAILACLFCSFFNCSSLMRSCSCLMARFFSYCSFTLSTFFLSVSWAADAALHKPLPKELQVFYAMAAIYC